MQYKPFLRIFCDVFNRRHCKPIAIPLRIISLIGVFLFGLHSCTSFKDGDESAMVYIKKEGDQYTLYRNGNPFYIRGASGDDNFKELNEIGGNTIRVYDTLQLANVLNRAQVAQLAVIVDLPLPAFTTQGAFYHNEQKVQQLINGYKKLIIKHAKHPALLAWNLGNEVNYPIRPKYQYFFNVFNELIATIHQNDPNHPVTTTLSRHLLRRRMMSLRWHSPDLDFISINVFGKLKDLEKDLDGMSWFWNGPYLLSEWGINGPWESDYTSWQAPIEATSTKKAEYLRTLYTTYLTKKDNNSLGNLVFYWGQKQECTHTWYSFFDHNNKRTAMVQELQQLWTKKPISHPPPSLDYMLIGQKGALDNCVFEPNATKSATIYFSEAVSDSLQIHWELYPENWGYNLGENQYQPPALQGLLKNKEQTTLTFQTPKKEGAYRLFSYVYDQHGTIATANTPFYVLKSMHE